MFFFIRLRDCFYPAYLESTAASILTAPLYQEQHHTVRYGRLYHDSLVLNVNISESDSPRIFVTAFTRGL